MEKSKWITPAIAAVFMLGAMLFFDSEPERFVPKPSNTIQIDTIGIKRSVLDSLLVRYVSTRNLKATVDSSTSDSYSVRIFPMGDPADFLSKNYEDMRTATRWKNGFEMKLEDNAPTYNLELTMNADNKYVVVPAGVLAMLLD